MEIRDKPEHDPVADLYIVDAYMRWALLAAEEVVGKKGLGVVLRDTGLERFIAEYPPDETKVLSKLTFGEYADLSVGLLNFFGRAGKGMLRRVGRLSADHGVKRQSALFGLAASLSSKLLPLPVQLKIGLTNMQNGFRKLSEAVGQEVHLGIEDRDDKLAYIDADCSHCAGKLADEPICFIRTGTLQEALHWLTAKQFQVQEVECRAMGAPACVWEISKTPQE
ncbi:MAG: 4-vinyl reductase [Anaerolineae bacterium]|nr:4-vinyl reductase [Anaerolineae bacterium]